MFLFFHRVVSVVFSISSPKRTRQMGIQTRTAIKIHLYRQYPRITQLVDNRMPIWSKTITFIQMLKRYQKRMCSCAKERKTQIFPKSRIYRKCHAKLIAFLSMTIQYLWSPRSSRLSNGIIFWIFILVTAWTRRPKELILTLSRQ